MDLAWAIRQAREDGQDIFGNPVNNDNDNNENYEDYGE